MQWQAARFVETPRVDRRRADGGDRPRSARRRALLRAEGWSSLNTLEYQGAAGSSTEPVSEKRETEARLLPPGVPCAARGRQRSRHPTLAETPSRRRSSSARPPAPEPPPVHDPGASSCRSLACRLFAIRDRPRRSAKSTAAVGPTATGGGAAASPGTIGGAPLKATVPPPVAPHGPKHARETASKYPLRSSGQFPQTSASASASNAVKNLLLAATCPPGSVQTTSVP